MSTTHPTREAPLIEYLESQVRRHREGVITQARSIAENLNRLADRLESHPERTVVSEIGEIGGAGPRLDAKCASYSEAVEALKAARGFAEES